MTKKLKMAALSAALLGSLVGSALSLPALAQTTSTPASPRNQVNLACVISALDKREAAVSAAFSAYSTAIQAALTARKSALDAAWNTTDRASRRQAIRNAWSDFRIAVRQAAKDQRAAKLAAWQTFYADRKSCGKGAAADDPTTHGVDQSF